MNVNIFTGRRQSPSWARLAEAPAGGASFLRLLAAQRTADISAFSCGFTSSLRLAGDAELRGRLRRRGARWAREYWIFCESAAAIRG